ncbi:MAG: hypothetical protein ACTSRZ_17555 [Promethearchaeota archaeon]
MKTKVKFIVKISSTYKREYPMERESKIIGNIYSFFLEIDKIKFFIYINPNNEKIIDIGKNIVVA